MIKITVVLCTYNRCQDLARALDSACALILPPSVECEIVVVDNNSCDRTSEVVADFSRRYANRFRYVFEPQPGLSVARNTGIREARGEIVAFMDDDLTVETTWLQNLTAGLRSGDCVGAGGRILPERAFSPPRWLSVESRYALAPLALFDLGPGACQLTEAPCGANMAFRKEMFKKYGGFRADLGRRPGSLMSNEDTEFGGRLLAAGEPLRYEPSAVVYHPVLENRLQKKYFLAWWFDKSRSDIRQFGVRPNTKFYWRGIPLYLFRNLAVWTLVWMVTFDPGSRFCRKIVVWCKAGQIFECHRRWRDTHIQKRTAAHVITSDNET
jgi:glucosyl-dolichyl phosphate glucuronosyltransferase